MINKKIIIFAISGLLLSWILSIFLWNVNYLNLKQQYRSNMTFYEVLISSLGNIRYTLAAYLWIRTEFYIHYSGYVAINNLPEIVYYTRFITLLDPNFVEAYDFGSYQLSFFLNKPNEGLNFVKEGIKNNNDYWKLYFTAGLIYTRKLENYDEAKKVLLKAENLLNSEVTNKKYGFYKVQNNEYLTLYRLISKCLYEQRDYKAALEYYNKSLKYGGTKYTPFYQDIIKQLYGR